MLLDKYGKTTLHYSRQSGSLKALKYFYCIPAEKSYILPIVKDNLEKTLYILPLALNMQVK